MGDGPSPRGPARLREADSSPRVLRAARWLRELLPGDSELGDPLSTAGDEPQQLVARRIAEAAAGRPSVARELGLGAVQVFQALSEAQGRGRGERELAILFTDLVDFSSWALVAGDEAAVGLVRSVGKVGETAVFQHGGRVVKRLGDGLMAVFDDAGGAVAAALDMRHGVAALSVDGYVPQLRAGVHTGRPRKIGGDYIGVDVNVAARVAGAADAGEVLVSGPVRDRVASDAIAFKRRRFRAKGAPKELEVYAVDIA
jgi:adenylate cyclase